MNRDSHRQFSNIVQFNFCQVSLLYQNKYIQCGCYKITMISIEDFATYCYVIVIIYFGYFSKVKYEDLEAISPWEGRETPYSIRMEIAQVN